MIWYMYTLWKHSSRRINDIYLIISYIYLLCVCVCVWKHLSYSNVEISVIHYSVIYCPSQCYILDPRSYSFYTWKLVYTFTNLFLLSPSPGNHLLALFLWVLPFLNYRYKHSNRYIQFISDIMQCLSFSLSLISFSLLKVLMLFQVAIFPFLLMTE